MNQTEWKTDVVLPSVSFAPLILPSQESVKDLEALEIGEEYTCRLCILLMRHSIYIYSCGASLTEAVLPAGCAQVLGEREISQNI